MLGSEGISTHARSASHRTAAQRPELSASSNTPERVVGATPSALRNSTAPSPATNGQALPRSVYIALRKHVCALDNILSLGQAHPRIDMDDARNIADALRAVYTDAPNEVREAMRNEYDETMKLLKRDANPNKLRNLSELPSRIRFPL